MNWLLSGGGVATIYTGTGCANFRGAVFQAERIVGFHFW